MSAPQPSDASQRPADVPGGPGALAVTALVVGVAAFLVGLVPFLGVVVGAAAVVLGVLALRRSTRGVGTGWTFGLVGLVTGGVAVLAGLVTTVLLVLGVAGLSGGPSSTVGAGPVPSPSRTGAPSAPSPSATRSTPPATPRLASPPAADPVTGPGETIEAADGISYTLTDLACGLPAITRGTLTATAQGQYCVADVTVVNGSTTPVKFYPTFTRAYAGGTEYAPDIDASVYADAGGAGNAPINPGQAQPGKIAFDIPTDVTLDTIQVRLGYQDATGEDDPGVSVSLS